MGIFLFKGFHFLKWLNFFFFLSQYKSNKINKKKEEIEKKQTNLI